MDCIGTWKIKEVLKFNENFERVWTDVDDILADETLEDSAKQMMVMQVIFSEDGLIRMVMPLPEGIPQEELDEALASGELKLWDEKTMLLEEHSWKMENGKLMYDTGMKGEVFGEAVSSWDEITEENGMLRLLSYRLTRV